jgi:hypothetical protein
MPKLDIAKIIGQISLLGFMILPVFSFTYSKVLANDTSHPGQESEVTTVLPTTPPASDKSGQENFTTGGVVVGSRENVINLIKIYWDRTESPTAIAIAMAESKLNVSAELRTANECSIGIFQINLAKDYCNGKWVHAGKVPGDTMEAKVAWLKHPENNIKIARQLYERQGWNPWSVYLNKSYLRFLQP